MLSQNNYLLKLTRGTATISWMNNVHTSEIKYREAALLKVLEPSYLERQIRSNEN